MAFEKIRDIIVEQLGVEPGEVTPTPGLLTILELIPWIL